ncbi:MAG: tetratricopeptide repeat protein, partial [Bacteroidota bacterium]
MKKIFILLLFSLFTLSFSFFTSSAQTWQQMMDSTKFYQEKNDFATALKWAQKALPKAETEFSKLDTNYVSTLGFTSEIFYNKGKLDSAVFYQEINLKLCRTLFIGDHPDLAASINDMAYFYEDKGNFKEAEPLFKEALEMRRRIFKGDHPDLAN